MSTMQACTGEFRESAVGLVLSEALAICRAADDLGMPNHADSWVREMRRARRKPVQRCRPGRRRTQRPECANLKQRSASCYWRRTS